MTKFEEEVHDQVMTNVILPAFAERLIQEENWSINDTWPTDEPFIGDILTDLVPTYREQLDGLISSKLKLLAAAAGTFHQAVSDLTRKDP